MTRVSGDIDVRAVAVRRGDAFIEAFASRDEPALREALAVNVHFRGLTPNHVWEAHGVGEAIEILLGSWIEASDHVESILSRAVRPIVDRVILDYRLRVRNADGVFLVEQQGVIVPAEDGRIADLSIVCSGFRPDSV